MSVTTREPGGTEIGSNQWREILTRIENNGPCTRAQNAPFPPGRPVVEQCIPPQLLHGHIVISDRYADSTLAYQGYGHGNDLEVLRHLLNFATGNLWPDLTLLLDIQPEQGLQRKRSGGEWNRLIAYERLFSTCPRRLPLPCTAGTTALDNHRRQPTL